MTRLSNWQTGLHLNLNFKFDSFKVKRTFTLVFYLPAEFYFVVQFFRLAETRLIEVSFLTFLELAAKEEEKRDEHVLNWQANPSNQLLLRVPWKALDFFLVNDALFKAISGQTSFIFQWAHHTTYSLFLFYFLVENSKLHL